MHKFCFSVSLLQYLNSAPASVQYKEAGIGNYNNTVVSQSHCDFRLKETNFAVIGNNMVFLKVAVLLLIQLIVAIILN